MKKQKDNDITIPYSDLDDAVENIIYYEYSEYYEKINRDSIKKVLKEHLEYAIEAIISEPLLHFRSNEKFWKDLENNIEFDDEF
jgi:hypothetical protein